MRKGWGWMDPDPLQRTTVPFVNCAECGDAVPRHRGSRCPECQEYYCDTCRPVGRHDCPPTE